METAWVSAAVRKSRSFPWLEVATNRRRGIPQSVMHADVPLRLIAMLDLLGCQLRLRAFPCLKSETWGTRGSC